MNTGYRGTDGDIAPVPFQYDGEFGYPHRTVDGQTMYSNTHFETEHFAWASILVSVKAGVRLAGDSVISARGILRAAEQKAADAAADYTLATDNYQRWANAQEVGEVVVNGIQD